MADIKQNMRILPKGDPRLSNENDIVPLVVPGINDPDKWSGRLLYHHKL